jgi:hypothetical protein
VLLREFLQASPRGLSERDEITCKRTHLEAGIQQVRIQRNAGSTPPLQRRAETPPGGLIREPANSLEVSGNRSIVFDRAALNDQLCIEPFVLQTKVQERPGRQRRQHSAATPKDSLMMVDVGCQGCGEQQVLGGRHSDPYTHGRRERDVLVQVSFHVLGSRQLQCTA